MNEIKEMSKSWQPAELSKNPLSRYSKEELLKMLGTYIVPSNKVFKTNHVNRGFRESWCSREVAKLYSSCERLETMWILLGFRCRRGTFWPFRNRLRWENQQCTFSPRHRLLRCRKLGMQWRLLGVCLGVYGKHRYCVRIVFPIHIGWRYWGTMCIFLCQWSHIRKVQMRA